MDSTSVVPCRTLLYAFSHVESRTRIRIGCGIHQLEPLTGHAQTSPFRKLAAIHIQGYCIGVSMLPVVECVNGSHLAFREVSNIAVEGLRLRNCRGSHQMGSRSPANTVGKATGIRFYSVYFDKCTIITMRDVELILTEHNNSDGIGCNLPLSTVRLSNIYVLQVNGWGDAISMSIFCGSRRNKQCKTTTSINNVGILRQGYSSPQSVAPPSDYYGISIVVYMGKHKVAVSNVSILDIGAYHSSAGGVSVTLLTKKNTIMLNNISVVSGWQRKLENVDTVFKPILHAAQACNTTITSKAATEHNMVANTSINAGIRIHLLSGGNENSITVERSLVSHCRIWPNFATVFTLWRWLHETILSYTYNQTLNSGAVTPPLRRVGLNIAFAQEAQGNKVSVARSVFAYNHGKIGGGISVSFSNRSSENIADIQQTTVAFNWAENGGGVFIDCQDRSRKNKAYFQKGHAIGNQAMTYGAGMFLLFQDEAAVNMVTIQYVDIAKNILHQSDIQGRMGGGIHVGLLTETRSDFTNVVLVILASFYHNQAVGGNGGGLSLLQYGSDYTYIQNSNRYSLQVIGCIFNNNTAVYGQAIALEALPIHGKRSYNGIQIISTAYSNRDVPWMQNTQWQEFFSNDEKKLLADWHQQELTFLQKMHRIYDPDEEVQRVSSGQSLVYMKAVAVQVGEFFWVVCDGSSQGIVAVESEMNIRKKSDFRVLDCVASNGGGASLLGESYIRVSDNTHMEFINNYAFSRGGAIYASFVQLQAHSFSCFLQYSKFPVIARDWHRVNTHSATTGQEQKEIPSMLLTSRHAYSPDLPAFSMNIAAKITQLITYLDHLLHSASYLLVVHPPVSNYLRNPTAVLREKWFPDLARWWDGILVHLSQGNKAPHCLKQLRMTWGMS